MSSRTKSAPDDSPILFKARQKNPARTVGIKLFVASEFDEWATSAFDEAVKDGVHLSSSAFIRIFDHATGKPPVPHHRVRRG